MIGRLVAWIRKGITELVDLLAAVRNYSAYERAVVRAAACGVRADEIHDTLCHTKLGSTYGCGVRDVVVIESLCLLASVGVPYGIRLQVLVGMVLRYQECFGPGAMPDHLLHNCARALATVMGKGRVPRQDFCQFAEAFPQFHKELGWDPRSGDVLNWFERAGGPDSSATIRPLDN